CRSLEMCKRRGSRLMHWLNGLPIASSSLLQPIPPGLWGEENSKVAPYMSWEKWQSQESSNSNRTSPCFKPSQWLEVLQSGRRRINYRWYARRKMATTNGKNCIFLFDTMISCPDVAS